MTCQDEMSYESTGIDCGVVASAVIRSAYLMKRPVRRTFVVLANRSGRCTKEFMRRWIKSAFGWYSRPTWASVSGDRKRSPEITITTTSWKQSRYWWCITAFTPDDISNADTTMLALYPQHVTVLRKPGVTKVLYDCPAIVGKGSPEQPVFLKKCKT